MDVSDDAIGGRRAPSDMLALKPYWGKSTVRNFREDNGDVGIIRSPVRAIVLPARFLIGLPLAFFSWLSTTVQAELLQVVLAIEENTRRDGRWLSERLQATHQEAPEATIGTRRRAVC
jgi:hypothetical protein